jgi:hypothetical protein
LPSGGLNPLAVRDWDNQTERVVPG